MSFTRPVAAGNGEMKTSYPCSPFWLPQFALEQVQLQVLATFLQMLVLSHHCFRPNALILGFLRPICVDNGITGLENQCARSVGSVSG
jgi:hypothetical protein